MWKVYQSYTVISECYAYANSQYQALPSPSSREPGYEANYSLTMSMHVGVNLDVFPVASRQRGFCLPIFVRLYMLCVCVCVSVCVVCESTVYCVCVGEGGVCMYVSSVLCTPAAADVFMVFKRIHCYTAIDVVQALRNM